MNVTINENKEHTIQRTEAKNMLLDTLHVIGSTICWCSHVAISLYQWIRFGVDIVLQGTTKRGGNIDIIVVYGSSVCVCVSECHLTLLRFVSFDFFLFDFLCHFF